MFSTNNDVLLRTHNPVPALNCIQYAATKKKVCEEDVIQSNKLGFGSKIGQITNRITAMTSLMSNYSPGSVEYETLKYRTQCGQSLQQSEIDKAKGILPSQMPKTWYVYSENKINNSDCENIIERKKLYQRICAHKKPYFFGYNYISLKTEYDNYISNIESKSYSLFGMSFEELSRKKEKNHTEEKFVNWAKNQMPLDTSPSVMNKICWFVEDRLDNVSFPQRDSFDYSMIKSGYVYKKENYKTIYELYKQYKSKISEFTKRQKYTDGLQLDIDVEASIEQIKDNFIERSTVECPNKYELCDIMIDICYKNRNSKDIVWDMCGDTIIENLLRHNNGNIYYPERVCSGEEFVCCGYKFVMKKLKIGGDCV